jgi:hypothetical protein
MTPMNNRLLRPRASGFNPRSIAGLQLWLNASDATSITLNGSAVSQWSDASGLNNHATQATANNQPAYSTNAVNGRPAVVFDGTNDVFRSSASFASTHSIFAVVKMDERRIAGIIGGSVNTDLIYGDGSSSFSGTRYGAFGVARAVYGGGTITTGVWQIVSVVLSGGTIPSSLSMWTNGVGGPVVTVTAGTAPNAKMDGSIYIGSSAGLHWLKGGIAEIIGYSSALGTSSRQQVEKYLSSKYAITLS